MTSDRVISTRRRSPARELVAVALPQVRDAELLEKRLEPSPALRLRKGNRLENRHEVVLDREAPEYRSLLGKVPDALARTFVHGELRDIRAVEIHRASVGADHPDEDVETGGLAGAVRAEEPDDLSLRDLDRDLVHDAAFAVDLDEAIGGKARSVHRRHDIDSAGGRRSLLVVSQRLAPGFIHSAHPLDRHPCRSLPGAGRPCPADTP